MAAARVSGVQRLLVWTDLVIDQPPVDPHGAPVDAEDLAVERAGLGGQHRAR